MQICIGAYFKDCNCETLALIAQKGGVGKTTIAVNLAVAAGVQTALFDLDQQESAVIWSDRRKKELPHVEFLTERRLPDGLQAAERQGFALAIIDTPPAAGPQAYTAAQSSDLVLIPCRPSLIDLDAIRRTALASAAHTGPPGRWEKPSLRLTHAVRLPERFHFCKIGFLNKCKCARLILGKRERRSPMARRSILTPALEERHASQEPVAAPAPPERPASATKPSRLAKLHIGGYFDPNDPTVIAFQKLRVDLRTSQQEMLLEAIRDFVAKHEGASAFRKTRG